jgi:hypothetical protein
MLDSLSCVYKCNVGWSQLCDRTGQYYSPIANLLEEINIDPRTLQKEHVPEG